MDDQIVSVSFGPGGHTLAVAGDRQSPRGTIHGDVEIWKLGDHPSLLRRLHGLDLTSWATYTPDGNEIVASGGVHSRIIGGRSMGSARVAEWNASSGVLVAPPMNLPTFGAFSVASNADGSRVAAGLPDGRALVIDPTGQKVVTRVHSSGGIVFSVAISPDGRTLATGSDIGTTQLWDMATGTTVGTEMKAADGFVIGAEFGRDGRSLLTEGSDGSTRLFDVQTQREIGNPFSGGDQTWDEASFTPDQSKIVVLFSDGIADLWPASLQSWENHACSVGRRSLTPVEWHQFVGSSYPYTKVCG
jgi:WD40 repeat protein